MINKKKYIILVVILFCGLFIFSLFFKRDIKQESNKSDSSKLVSGGGEINNIEQKYCNFFPKRRRLDYKPELNEKGAIAVFFDERGQKKVLYQKNKEKKMPIASLTKLMTAVIAVENYDLQKTVKVSKKAVATLEETGKLRPGERITIGGLLDLALLVSSNDAAAALAEQMGEEKFVKLMNKKAEEIGMKNTKFANPHGLDNKNNYSTAEDLAFLTQYSLIYYPRIWETLSKKQKIIRSEDHLGSSIEHCANNTNKLLAKDYVLGGKTGYTDKAGDAMILAMEAPGIAEGKVVLVLLGLGVAERIPRTENLYDWVMWGWDWGHF